MPQRAGNEKEKQKHASIRHLPCKQGVAHRMPPAMQQGALARQPSRSPPDGPDRVFVHVVPCRRVDDHLCPGNRADVEARAP
eukprot:5078172-Lingulodinium_polyedra.AAC.1